METSVWIVVLCAIAGVCTACDMESITGCKSTIETKFTSLSDKFSTSGGTMSEKKYNQKICGYLETYWSCVTPLLSGCPRDIIKENNEYITGNSKHHNCVEPVTIAMGTIESTKGWETFPSTEARSTVTHGRHNGGKTTTVYRNTGSRTNGWGMVSTEDATPRWTGNTDEAIPGNTEASHVSHVATDVTPDAANPAVTTVLTGAPTTVSVAPRGAGSGVVMTGMVTMVTICVYE